MTYRISNGATARYFKWQPENDEVSLEREVGKLAWVNDYLSSPRVIEFGHAGNAEWVLTQAIIGNSAVSPQWLSQPAAAVHAVGRGLRELHDQLPVDKCPWRWDPADRALRATQRGIDMPAELCAAPEPDRLVVCHGDACCPNTILDDDGSLAGHVDFGSLGVADRWSDIAVAAMSTRWNYGPGWEESLVAAYGVPIDRARMDYYQQLWNAT